jgi:hypothetical protein
MLEFSKKGLQYVQVLIWPLPSTRQPVAAMPSTVAVVPWLAKPVKLYSPSLKQSLHAEMMTDFMGEIERAQLQYASCTGEGHSCTKP